MIRVVLADDHTIVREGLKQLLTAAGDLQVVGEAQNGHEVIERVRELEFGCCCSTCRCRQSASS